MHDSLTNLPNRSAFMQELGRVLARSKRMQRLPLLGAVCRRRSVQAGERQPRPPHRRSAAHLGRAASSPRACATGDVLARLGGDEFTILLDGVNGTGDVEFVAERVQSRFRDR